MPRKPKDPTQGHRHRKEPTMPKSRAGAGRTIGVEGAQVPTPDVERAAGAIRLWLPEPPSVNRNQKLMNKYSASRERNFYKAQAWADACRQCIPFMDPPAYVRIDAELRLFGLRDEDNAWASLKWAIDALKQRQKREAFRHGLYLGRGFFVDDDAAHIGLVPPVQVVDRGRRGLLLTVTPCGAGSVLTYQELEAEVARLRDALQTRKAA